MMAIEMIGGVYCPLSPRDPDDRLYQLIDDTRSHFILLHWQTKHRFVNKSVFLEIDLLLTNYHGDIKLDIHQLTGIVLSGQSIAYIVVTSGSTGSPKAVSLIECKSFEHHIFVQSQAQVRHRNICECLHSMTHIGALNGGDTVIQMARCSFDVHVQEILSSMMLGATTIMLHPGGTIDFNYLSTVLQRKQVTFMTTVPSLFINFFTFIRQSIVEDGLKCLRSIISGGM